MPRCCTTSARSACASRSSSRRRNCTRPISAWCATATRSSGERRAEYLEANGKKGYEGFVNELDASHKQELAELDRFLEVVLQANEPSILPDGSFDELEAWSKRNYLAFDGATEPFLSPDEMRYLTIRKGSLDDAERHEIESHVTHTYQFLQRIPWTRWRN